MFLDKQSSEPREPSIIYLECLLDFIWLCSSHNSFAAGKSKELKALKQTKNYPPQNIFLAVPLDLHLWCCYCFLRLILSRFQWIDNISICMYELEVVVKSHFQNISKNHVCVFCFLRHYDLNYNLKFFFFFHNVQKIYIFVRTKCTKMIYSSLFIELRCEIKGLAAWHIA